MSFIEVALDFEEGGREAVAATRIDGVLADPRTAFTVLRVECIPSEGIPGHRPLRFDLAVEAAS